MPTSGGYIYWDSRILGLGMYIAGRRIQGGLKHPSGADYSRGMPGVSLATVGGSDVLQQRFFGGDVPLNLEPFNVSFSMLLVDQADADAILEAVDAVDLWPDMIIADKWSIPHASAGQTTWKASRRFPWGLGFVTTVNRAPRVFIDSVEQTVIYAGAPAAGEVLVPSVGGYGVITTPAGIEGTYLTLRYHPLFTVRVAQADLRHNDVNDLTVDVTISEVRSQLYSVAI